MSPPGGARDVPAVTNRGRTLPPQALRPSVGSHPGEVREDSLPEEYTVPPAIAPALDAGFQPAALASAAIESRIGASAHAVPVAFALQQPAGAVRQFATVVYPADHPDAAASYVAFGRLLKFVLWSHGGCRLYLDGPEELAAWLRRRYGPDGAGAFDARMMGERIYGRPFEVVAIPRDDFPASRDARMALGHHLDGCRIGFDLGASDRKVAAVADGTVLYSEEVTWDPVTQADPQWHFDEIMASLRSAAAHLPRVDAIGGSAAGVYVDSEVRVASLFRAVPKELFETRVRDIFREIQRAWNGVPLEVVNDGEVTALAGAMMADVGGLLGIAMGSSLAAGYVDRERRLTSWLNELAFAPIDHSPGAPLDEWSGDRGCGVQYLSQQATARLLGPAGIDLEPGLPLPERLLALQSLMASSDERARRVYETIGTYLGYALLHYRRFYELDHVLLLGRVMTGSGGDVIVEGAREVLRAEDPAFAERMVIHVASERDKRHGQAVAAASLPALA